jgi:hypothetical protein
VSADRIGGRRHPVATIPTLLACGVAIGCVGELSPTSGGGPGGGADLSVDAGGDGESSTARALFEANVHPVVLAACSPAGACHTAQDPAFVALERTAAYDRIQLQRDRLYPGYEADGARLVANGGGNHYGAVFTPADLEAIRAWLAAEKAAADGGDTAASPLAIWSGCMNLAEWDAEGVAAAWSNKQAQGQGQCETCHNLGADGFMASDQSKRVFDSITRIPALMPSYFTLDATGTEVVINRTRLEKVGTRQPPHEEHGPFPVDGDAMDRLIRFYNLTKLRRDSGQCDPPRFP